MTSLVTKPILFLSLKSDFDTLEKENRRGLKYGARCENFTLSETFRPLAEQFVCVSSYQFFDDQKVTIDSRGLYNQDIEKVWPHSGKLHNRDKNAPEVFLIGAC